MAQPAKKPKRQTKYSAEYQKEYPFIVPDHLYKFHCTSCNVNVSCAHGGINYVKFHVSTNKHISSHKNCERK